MTLEERRNSLMQTKVGTFVLILTLILLTTVSPSFTVVAVKMACDVFELHCKFIETVTMLTHYFYMLEIINFVVNPVFYAWRITTYRKAFWKMFGRAGRKNWQMYFKWYIEEFIYDANCAFFEEIQNFIISSNRFSLWPVSLFNLNM